MDPVCMKHDSTSDSTLPHPSSEHVLTESTFINSRDGCCDGCNRACNRSDTDSPSVVFELIRKRAAEKTSVNMPQHKSAAENQVRSGR